MSDRADGEPAIGLVELIRRGIEVYNTGDYESLAPGYTRDATAMAPTIWLDDQSIVSGRDEIVRRYHTLPGAFESVTLIEERLFEGDDTVYGSLIMRCLPFGLASVIDRRIIVIYRFRGNQVCHVGFYTDVEEALESERFPDDVVRAHREPQS